MKNWEYHVGQVATLVDPVRIADVLNAAGEEGWELVVAIPDDGGIGGRGLLTIFKRPVAVEIGEPESLLERVALNGH